LQTLPCRSRAVTPVAPLFHALTVDRWNRIPVVRSNGDAGMPHHPLLQADR